MRLGWSSMTNEFVETLFGEQEGYVYSPVNTLDEEWRQYFFKWPQGGNKLEAHIAQYNDRDVYLSPVLFSKREISPESFKGTYHLWTEFDKTKPPVDSIPPSIRVQSSLEGREHWYWRLNEFTTNLSVVEDLNRRIAYHYGADLSAWDYQQVLRPPDTWNHKRNKPVVKLEQGNRLYSVDNFLQFPFLPLLLDLILTSMVHYHQKKSY